MVWYTIVWFWYNPEPLLLQLPRSQSTDTQPRICKTEAFIGVFNSKKTDTRNGTNSSVFSFVISVCLLSGVDGQLCSYSGNTRHIAILESQMRMVEVGLVYSQLHLIFDTIFHCLHCILVRNLVPQFSPSYSVSCIIPFNKLEILLMIEDTKSCSSHFINSA